MRNLFTQSNNTLDYALVGALFGLMFPIIATLIRIYDAGVSIGLSSIILVQSTDRLLWIIDTAPIFLGLFAAYAGRRQDNLKKLYDVLQEREKELASFQVTLEERINMRLKDLIDANLQTEKRAAQLKTVSSVARTIASTQEINTLLPEIAKLVSDQFGFYHTGIFLVDDLNEFAVLRASNSVGGAKMLSRQHKLKLDTHSIVGYAASRGEPRIALDVGADSVYFNNPDLPGTHSEMALPLRASERVIGVLDVQSTQSNAFAEGDVDTLATLADQITIAIENARLFSEARIALGESEEAFSRYVKQEWGEFASQSKNTGYVFDGNRTTVLDKKDKRERAKPLPQTGGLSLEKDSAEIAIPIKFRGQVIGILDVKSKKGNRQWSQDEITLLESAAERAAFALENARLVETAQRRASRERAIGEISSKIGAVSDLEAIMQAAVEELGRRISGTTEVTIELETDDLSK